MTDKKTTNEKPDYNTLFHTEARVLAQGVVDIIFNKKEDFIADTLETDPKKMRAQEEANVNIGIEVIQLLSKSKLPADYSSLVFDKIIDSLTGLKQFVGGTINQNEDEIMSRIYGKKNYKGKFRKEEVTVGDVLLKLDEVREKTGGDKSDYFDDAPVELPVEEDK